MDRQSHYKRELTADDLNTIWYALTDRANRLYKEAEETPGLTVEDRGRKRKLARECQSLYQQINRMKNRW